MGQILPDDQFKYPEFPVCFMAKLFHQVKGEL